MPASFRLNKPSYLPVPSAPGKLAISRRTWLASASSMATRLTRYFVCSPHARACGQPLTFGKLSVVFVESSETIVAREAGHALGTDLLLDLRRRSVAKVLSSESPRFTFGLSRHPRRRRCPEICE